MGIIENLDFNNIDLKKFKNFKCLCELCDCGCFDQTKQIHHPECKRRLAKKLSRPFTNHETQRTCPISHYKDTFKANYNPRPATTANPPPDSCRLIKGPMDLKTIQKIDYKPYEPQERAKPIKNVDNYERSSDPFIGNTSYKSEYFLKENNGLANIVSKSSNEQTMILPLDKISGNTTTKEHFREWNTKLPSKGYSEYPSYAGESLFPTRERSFYTSTSGAHKPIDVTKLGSLPKAEMKGTLVSEGEMQLGTNYRDTYIKFNDVERVKKISPRSQSQGLLSNSRAVISGTTQTKSDFVYYNYQNPPKPANVNTFNSDLDQQIYPGISREHSTMYSTDFITPKDPVKAKTCKKENPIYQRPSEKIESETVTKRDFKPIDISKIPNLTVKINSHLKIPGGPMENKTTSMLHFIPYEVKPIVMAKDPNPSYYVPNKSKFVGETTTGQTYLGQKGFKPPSFKPDYDNITIDKTKSIDANSSYKTSYINHGLTMCEAKAFLIANAISNRNVEKSQEAETPKLTTPKVELTSSVQT